MIDTTLLIALFILEVLAFGWLIWEAKKGREQRETILEVERQILNLEKTIMSMEKTMIKKVDRINNFTKREKYLLQNEKLIKNDRKNEKKNN
jgi:hypothetical protein